MDEVVGLRTNRLALAKANAIPLNEMPQQPISITNRVRFCPLVAQTVRIRAREARSQTVL